MSGSIGYTDPATGDQIEILIDDTGSTRAPKNDHERGLLRSLEVARVVDHSRDEEPQAAVRSTRKTKRRRVAVAVQPKTDSTAPVQPVAETEG